MFVLHRSGRARRLVAATGAATLMALATGMPAPATAQGLASEGSGTIVGFVGDISRPNNLITCGQVFWFGGGSGAGHAAVVASVPYVGTMFGAIGNNTGCETDELGTGTLSFSVGGNLLGSAECDFNGIPYVRVGVNLVFEGGGTCTVNGLSGPAIVAGTGVSPSGFLASGPLSVTWQIG